jgi:hypothetical protein
MGQSVAFLISCGFLILLFLLIDECQTSIQPILSDDSSPVSSNIPQPDSLNQLANHDYSNYLSTPIRRHKRQLELALLGGLAYFGGRHYINKSQFSFNDFFLIFYRLSFREKEAEKAAVLRASTAKKFSARKFPQI